MPSHPHPPRRHRLATLVASTLTAALGAGTPGWSHGVPAAPPHEAAPGSLPMSATLSFETIEFEGGEDMGLLGASLLFEALPGWWGGIGVYGAATGERGGFFVGGAEVQRRWRLAERVELQAGLFVGGGGGGGAPVGSGLMLRPQVSLLVDVARGVRTGVSASRVEFPDGRIASNQLGWVLSFDDHFTWQDWRPGTQAASSPSSWSGRGGLGVDRLAITAGRHRLGTNSRKSAAAADTRDVPQVGARADRWLGEHWYASVEAAGAAGGGADGYAEALGGAGWEHGLQAIGLPQLALGARGALGLGGGGDLSTGGGVIGKLSTTLTWNLHRDYYVGIEAGTTRALDGDLSTRYAQLMVGLRLDHPDAPPGAPMSVVRQEWSLSLQRATRAARKQGGSEALDSIGLRLNRYVSPRVYLSAQAHSAYGGGAGAYSVGLVGLGWSDAFDGEPGAGRWTYGAELLAGAAGGGGVDSGGAIGQALAWLGVRLARDGELRLGLGRVQALQSEHGLGSPLIDLSWTQSFGVGSR